MADLHSAADEPCPVGVSIRVRGNPARLSNTAGDAGNHSTPNAGRFGRSCVSQLELLSALERGLDPLAQRADLAASLALDLGVAAALLQQLVGHVERHHDGDAIESYDLAAVADLAHAAVQVLRRIEKCRALVVRAGDHVLFLHDAHADVRLILTAHAPCSRVFSLPIMASTRVRTCSFLERSEARSV